MNASKILMVVLVAAFCASAAAPVFAAEEIDRGVFKWLYSKETEQIYKKPIPLAEVTKNPRPYFNLPVTLTVRFHRIERGLYVPEFTPFNPENYLNFSVWDSTAELWNEEAIRADYPLMFVEKDSQAAQDLVRLKKFDIVEIYGAIESLFEGKPWFEVRNIWLRRKSELTSTLFSHIRLAEDMFAKGQYDLTVGELDRILGYELSGDLSGMLYKRKGESLLALEKHAEAVTAFDHAVSYRGEDADVYRGLGLALTGIGDYERALWALEKSLVFKAKQANVYAMKGYARGKLTDERVRVLSVDKDYLKEVDPESIRRRDKKIRAEYDPGKIEVTRRIRSKITERIYYEVVEQYELALLDCRKALFIDPTNARAGEALRNIEDRLAAFKDQYGPKETPAEEMPAPEDE